MGLNTFYLFSFENYYNQNVSRYFEEVGVSGNYYEIKDKIDFTSWLAAIAFLTAIVLPAYLGYALVSATLNNLPNSLPRIPLLNQPPEVEPEVENNEPLPEEIPSELEAKPSGT